MARRRARRGRSLRGFEASAWRDLSSRPLDGRAMRWLARVPSGLAEALQRARTGGEGDEAEGEEDAARQQHVGQPEAAPDRAFEREHGPLDRAGVADAE